MKKRRNIIKRLIFAIILCLILLHLLQKVWEGDENKILEEFKFEIFENVTFVEDRQNSKFENVIDTERENAIDTEPENIIDTERENRHEILHQVFATKDHDNSKYFETNKLNKTEINLESDKTIDKLESDVPPKHKPYEEGSEESNANLIFAEKMFENKFKKHEQIDEIPKITKQQKLKQKKISNKVEIIHDGRRPGSIQTNEGKKIISETKNYGKEEFIGQLPIFNDYDLPLRKVTLNNENSTDKRSNERDLNDAIENSEAMEGVFILGEINPKLKYATFSTTTENRESLNYIFFLPLTTLAWKRIGYNSVIIIVGAKEEWNRDPIYDLILNLCRQLDAIFVFLEPRPDKSVMISQVGRIFVGNILRSVFKGIDEVYLITSDADIWPIYSEAYSLPVGREILSLNSDCCSPFSHRGISYRMLPMANIGMKIGTWRKITQKFSNSPRSIDDILTFSVREFGNIALRAVHKGDNVGWFLDQMLISVLIAQWTKEHTGKSLVKYVPRNVGLDRIDRNGWNHGNEIDDKIDAHLLMDAYIPGVWVRVARLLRAMFGDGSDKYLWCLDYYEKFQTLFTDKYRKSPLGA